MLLKQLTKALLERALEAELTEHLEYETHDSWQNPMDDASDIALLLETDLPDVLALEKSCFVSPWSLEQLQSSLRQGTLILLGAKEAERLLGYVSLNIFAPEMEILNVAVALDKRGKGLGRALVGQGLEYGFQQGARTCFLEVAADNLHALNLYSSLGFAAIGARRGYYQRPGRNVDAVVMKRDLPLESRCISLKNRHEGRNSQ